jgi:adenylate kinase
VDRVVGLRTDPETGKTYHLKYNPPPASAEVHARLIQRNSHTEPMIRGKLAQFRRHFGGVTSCFKNLRKFSYEAGVVGNEDKVLKDVADFTGTKKATRAPRQFKIILAGRPGSGKTSLAHLLSKSYGFVHGWFFFFFFFLYDDYQYHEVAF